MVQAWWRRFVGLGRSVFLKLANNKPTPWMFGRFQTGCTSGRTSAHPVSWALTLRTYFPNEAPPSSGQPRACYLVFSCQEAGAFSNLFAQTSWAACCYGASWPATEQSAKHRLFIVYLFTYQIKPISSTRCHGEVLPPALHNKHRIMLRATDTWGIPAGNLGQKMNHFILIICDIKHCWPTPTHRSVGRKCIYGKWPWELVNAVSDAASTWPRKQTKAGKQQHHHLSLSINFH